MFKPIRLVAGVMGTAVVFSLAVAGPARADRLFRWKFQVGETLQYKMIQEIDQNILTEPEKPPLSISSRMAMDIVWRVKAIDDQGTITLDQTIEKIRIKMQSAQGVLLDYDSTQGKEPEGMGKMLLPMFEAMHKKPFQIRMTAQGEIKEVKLPQGIPESMNQLMGGQGGAFFNEDWVKQFGTFAFFPEKPVTVGGTWTTKRKVKIPALGNPVMETTFRYEAAEKRNGKTLDKLSALIRFLPEAEKKENTPKIQDQEGYRGTILFDPERGMVVESRGKSKMKMEIPIMGQRIVMEMTTKEEMKFQEGKASTGNSPQEK